MMEQYIYFVLVVLIWLGSVYLSFRRGVRRGAEAMGQVMMAQAAALRQSIPWEQRAELEQYMDKQRREKSNDND